MPDNPTVKAEVPIVSAHSFLPSQLSERNTRGVSHRTVTQPPWPGIACGTGLEIAP